jgi:anti-sigma-K factor RskA
MNTKINEARELPEDVELLLPWHAAGTLSRRDAARVEAALANDNELAARYELVREELGEAIRLNESLGAPSARAMEKLFAKIDAEPVRKPKASFSITAWLIEFVASFQPRTLAYGATAAALAIVLQAGILAGVFVKERTTGPQLASYTQSDSAGEGAFVLIRFKAEASLGDITRFLEENKATVVDGPAAGSGLFRLRVADQPLSQPELGAIVKRMARSPVVGFTVPAAQP